MSDDPKSPSHDEPPHHPLDSHSGEVNPDAPYDQQQAELSSGAYEQALENEMPQRHDPLPHSIDGGAEGEYAQTEESAESYEAQGYYETEEGYTPEQGYESGHSYEEQAYTPPAEIVPTRNAAVEHAAPVREVAAANPAPPETPVAASNVLKSIAPRQTIRSAQKRLEEEQQQKRAANKPPMRPAEAEALDSDSKILALTHQLQELITHKKENDTGVAAASVAADAATTDAAVNKVRRGAAFKQSGTQVAMRPPPLAPLAPMASLAPQMAGDTTPPSGGLAPLMSHPSLPAFSGPDYAPRTPWLKRGVLLLLAFVLLAGTFAVGRMSAPEPVDPKRARRDGFPAAPSANAWSDAAIAQLDQVLAADQNGEMDAVFRMAYNLKSTAKQAAGLDVYLANIESRRQNYNEAEALLSQTSTGQDSAAINDQFGYSFTRRRDFDKATLWLTRAAADNPFSADIFYRLAEALRRKGNLQQAVDKFHQCLLRMPTEAQFDDLREWTGLKMRMTQLELGKSAELRGEMEAHLNQPNPSGYWLMTGAAMYLQGGDMASAAETLGKAQSALGAKHFDALMSDYFFRSYADREPIRSFFTEEAAAKKRKQDSRTAYFVDP